MSESTEIKKSNLGRQMEANMTTVKLKYEVRDEFAKKVDAKIKALRNKAKSTRQERVEAEIDVATESLANYVQQFSGTIGDVEFNPETNVQSVHVNFADPEAAKKFDAYMNTNPPLTYRLRTLTLAEKAAKLKDRMNAFVGKTVKAVRMGTRDQVVTCPEVLWFDDGFETEPTVWVLITFTDNTSVAFDAENHGFPGWGAVAAKSGK